MTSTLRARHVGFLGLILVALVIFRQPLSFLAKSSLSVDQYSHILLVVPVSLTLLYQTRHKLLANVAFSLSAGIFFLIWIAVFAYLSWRQNLLSASGYLSLSILLFGLCCLSAFTFSYGAKAFWAGAFPLFFLLLMAPLPDPVLEAAIAGLRNGSAVVTCWLFDLARIPYVRHGVVLLLPRIDIYIADECSGIRSSMVLLLSALVLGHLYLRTFGGKLLLALAVFPVTVAKNGLRIFVLSTLGMYVDPSFLSGRLHHDGGFIFFGLAFAGLFSIIWVLQKIEVNRIRKPA